MNTELWLLIMHDVNGEGDNYQVFDDHEDAITTAMEVFDDLEPRQDNDDEHIVRTNDPDTWAEVKAVLYTPSAFVKE